MKKIAFILIMFCVFTIKAQVNLVPNPSFEDTIGTPFGCFNISHTEYWGSGNLESPDLFHTIIDSIYCGIPFNQAGHQTPVTGDAYAGIAVMYFNFTFREYLQVRLTNSLQNGECYKVSFYYSFAEVGAESNWYYMNNCVTKNIALQFSDTIPINTTTDSCIAINPNYYVSDTTLVDSINTSIWYYFNKEYTANGGEQYITIGNFHGDSVASVIDDGSVFPTWITGNSYISYLYVDDVSVMQCEELGTYNCVENSCVSPGDGSGTYNSLTACQDSCGSTALQEHNFTKKLLRIVDAFGVECTANPNKMLFYIFSDGTVEKRIIIE